MGDISVLNDGVWLPCESIPLVQDKGVDKLVTIYEVNCKGSKWRLIDYPRLSKKSSLNLLLSSKDLIYSYEMFNRSKHGKHRLFRSESEQLELEKAIAKTLEGDRLHKTINEDLERMKRLKALNHPEKKYFPDDPLFASVQALGLDPKGATAQALGIDPSLASTQAQLGSESLLVSQLLDEQDGIDNVVWPETAEGSGVAKAVLEANLILKTPLEEALDSGLGYQDIFNSIHDYTSNLDKILLSGVNAEAARALIEPHRALMDAHQQHWNIPKPKKPRKKNLTEKYRESEAKRKKAKSKYAKLRRQFKILKRKTKKEKNEKIAKIKEENRQMLLAMSRSGPQGVTMAEVPVNIEPTATDCKEPRWEDLRRGKRELGLFIIDAIAEYWRVSPQKQARIPADWDALKRWLIFSQGSNASTSVVRGYILRISRSGITNIAQSDLPRELSFRALKRSFDTILNELQG